MYSAFGSIRTSMFVSAAPSIRRSKWKESKYRVMSSKETTMNAELANLTKDWPHVLWLGSYRYRWTDLSWFSFGLVPYPKIDGYLDSTVSSIGTSCKTRLTIMPMAYSNLMKLEKIP